MTTVAERVITNPSLDGGAPVGEESQIEVSRLLSIEPKGIDTFIRVHGDVSFEVGVCAYLSITRRRNKNITYEVRLHSPL